MKVRRILSVLKCSKMLNKIISESLSKRFQDFYKFLDEELFFDKITLGHWSRGMGLALSCSAENSQERLHLFGPRRCLPRPLASKRDVFFITTRANRSVFNKQSNCRTFPNARSGGWLCLSSFFFSGRLSSGSNQSGVVLQFNY